MHILLATPSSPRSLDGNAVTARRWCRIWRRLGHRVSWFDKGGKADLLVALHARKSFPALRLFRERWPERPLVVALTGTDLYRDLPHSREAQLSLRWAARLVALQPKALEILPGEVLSKCRVIPQSATPLAAPPPRARRHFLVTMVGNIRPEKDPLTALKAIRLLPPESRLRLRLVGAGLDEELTELVRRASGQGRFLWLGARPHWQARRLIAASRLLLITSRMEGGANVLSEALADGTPVCSSRIPGIEGTLGEDYPGFFPPGNVKHLAALLHRAERDPAYYASLQEHCRRCAKLVRPEREEEAWRTLLNELC